MKHLKATKEIIDGLSTLKELPPKLDRIKRYIMFNKK